MVVFENEHFIVSQCKTCDIPGYLILECKDSASCLSDLPSSAQRELGVLIGQLEFCITKVLNPEKVYLGKFGESGGRIHFHVFPRLPEVTSKYLELYPAQKNLIHGPVLLDWAREYYKVKEGLLSQNVVSIARDIEFHLNTT